MSKAARVGMLGLCLAAAGAAVTGCGGGGANASAGSGQLVSLVTTAVPPATTGVAYAAKFEATFVNPGGVYQVVGGALPPGLKLDIQSGELTGYPRQTGAFHFEVGARDGVDLSLPPGRDESFAQDRKTYDLNVVLGPPNILPQVVPTAQYRASYAYQIDVAGGTKPYAFTKIGGTLPNGLKVGATGLLGNFPTSSGGNPYNFQVQVTDANGQTDVDTLSLDVIVLPLIVLTASLPEAAVGFGYDQIMQLASSGAGAPISWSQQAPVAGEVLLSSIGMELSLDGHLRNAPGFTGPTTLGSFTFTIAVQDEALQVATRQLTLKVNPGPVITSISPNRASSPGPYTVTGMNLQPGALVVFKPGPTQTTATTTFVSASSVTFKSPAPKPSDGSGGVDVMIKNPDGGTFTKTGAFVFPATTIAFGTKGYFASALSSTGLAVADLNGDGKPDLVHCGAASMTVYGGGPTSTNAGLIVHMNQGGSPPTFGSTTLDTGNYYDVKIADVNSDGKPDIVALGQSSIRVWLNGVSGNPLGTLSVGPSSTLASGIVYPSVLAVGKLNSDGLLDVAIGVPHNPSYGMSNTYGRVDVMMGTGTGAFTLQDSANGTMPWTTGVVSMACVDSDGNGRDELAVGMGMNNYTSYPPLNYVATTATGTFGTWTTKGTAVAPPYYGGTTCVAVGDFLGTGTLSVLTTHSSTYSSPARVLSLYSGSGLSSQTNLTAPTTVMKCVAGIDADFDATIDFAVSTVASNIIVYKGSTKAQVVTLDASIGSPSVSTPRTGKIVSADIDGDGRPDLICTTSWWQVEEMAANYGSSYALGASGNGGSMGIVFYLNTSN